MVQVTLSLYEKVLKTDVFKNSSHKKKTISSPMYICMKVGARGEQACMSCAITEKEKE